MIGQAVEFIRKETRKQLGVADDEVIVNSARKLIDANNAAGAYICLINVEEEVALRNLPHTTRRNGSTSYLEPPVHLNLYLLFAFEFQTYAASLLHLAKTIELFQSKRWFDATTQAGPGDIAFPPGLDKLVFEMVNLNFEELNNLWGVLGGSYFPSVVYKMRLIKIQDNSTQIAPEITAIQLDTITR